MKKLRDKNQFLSVLYSVISEHYQKKDFNVSMLAKNMGISERVLCRYCGKHSLNSPNRIITTLRIEKSKTLILEEMKFADVANKVGYRSGNSFFIAFKKEIGTNISQFKALNDLHLSTNQAVYFKSQLNLILENNYWKNEFCVSMLANLMVVSEIMLLRRCRKYLLATPSEIIVRFRIEKSKALILGNMKHSDAAKKVGIQSLMAFRSAFKRETGKPVGLFRELNSKELSDNSRLVFMQFVSKLSKYSGIFLENTSKASIIKILKNDFGIILPQKRSLIDSLKASNSDHELIELLIDYLTMKNKMTKK